MLSTTIHIPDNLSNIEESVIGIHIWEIREPFLPESLFSCTFRTGMIEQMAVIRDVRWPRKNFVMADPIVDKQQFFGCLLIATEQSQKGDWAL